LPDRPVSDAAQSTPLRFEPIEKIVIARQAFDRIRSLVLSGQLKPGDALPPERNLALQLGVSRSSLREAIRALTIMNVLETHHGSGTFVTSMDPSLLIEPIEFMFDVPGAAMLYLFETRQVIESNAARLAATRITDEELDEIDRLMSEAEQHLDEPMTFLSYDFSIHSAIITATKNPILIKIASSMARLSMESRKRTTWLPSVRSHAHDDHKILASHLRAHDADAAQQAMEQHLAAVRTGYLSWLESQQQAQELPEPG
jgi:GntR family transcriptional repressor for pyruvate dehydrogenase complex